MSINSFFTETLGANLRNTRWSWGAYDPTTDRVFLRVWEHEFRNIEGREAVQVLRNAPNSRSPGYNERRRHLGQIQQGACGYGVICRATDPDADGPRTIRHFNDSFVTELTQIIDRNEATYAVVGDRIPTQDLAHSQTASSTVADDVTSLIRKKDSATNKERLIQARLGQGDFRRRVLRQWDNKCAVTGVTVPEVLRASHIKPWRSSNNTERLDCHNGLPLIATLDALFDAGHISFDDNGNTMASSRLPASLVSRLRLKGSCLSSEPSRQMSDYLNFHGTEIFSA